MQNMLIHIGYGKAASTSLQAWFSRHSDIWEFSVNSIIKNNKTQKKVCVVSDERLSLGVDYDFSTGLICMGKSIHTYRSEVCETLASIFPNAHILIITRGFRGFIESFYSQYVSKGGILTYTEFQIVYKQLLSELLDYNCLIGLYRKNFTKVTVLPMELLGKSPQQFFTTIELSLGLDNNGRLPDKALNKRMSNKQIYYYPKFSKIWIWCTRRLSLNESKRLHGVYVNWFLRGKLGALLCNLMPDSPPPTQISTISDFYYKASILDDVEFYNEFKEDYFLSV